jgi:hypothetical protein
VFTARYALSPYIKQIRFVFRGLKTKFHIRILALLVPNYLLVGETTVFCLLSYAAGYVAAWLSLALSVIPSAAPFNFSRILFRNWFHVMQFLPQLFLLSHLSSVKFRSIQSVIAALGYNFAVLRCVCQCLLFSPSVVAPDLYLEGALFESRLEHLLS